MAEDETVDLSFIPETFKSEEGDYDTGKFRESYDELVSFKAQADEASALIPGEPTGYEFTVPEGHEFPEGFDPEVFAGKDDDGNPIEFDVNSMIQPDDPDLPLLQAALHEAGAKPELMGKLASILANREIRSAMKMADAAGDHLKALGPEGQSRVDTVKRAVSAKLPEAQASAVLDGITSADALRGMETLLKSLVTKPPSADTKKIDNSTASIDDRILTGLRQRSA